KRDVVVSDVVKHATKACDPNRWYFDTGTNAHIVANKEYFTSLQRMDDSDWNPTVSGFTDSGVAQAEGFGTVLLATMVDEQMVTVFLEDVLYVSRAGCNLFSPGQALDQGFKMSWDQDTKLFGMSKEGTEVIRTTYEHQLWTFVTPNVNGKKAKNSKISTKKHVIVNFTYIRLMGDRGMAKGIMLKKRGKFDCADCHFGKQKRKTFQKNLERKITRVNDMVFADLLIPGVHNGTQYTAVLVVMDGYSHFVTTYLMKSRTRSKVNQLMKQYIAWAERQHGNVLEKL
ncbi:Retroelement pol Polyprotein, partial [Phytophthora megakarya]